MSHKLNDFLELTGLGEEVLEHSGVKGMRWGVRKAIKKALRSTRPHATGHQVSNKRKFKGVLGVTIKAPKKLVIGDNTGHQNSVKNKYQGILGMTIKAPKKLVIGDNTGHQNSIKNKYQGALGKRFKTRPIRNKKKP